MDTSDSEEIRNLIGRLAWLTDTWSTVEEYLSNCSEDYSWQIEGLPAYVGHQGVARRLREMLDEGICGPGLPTRHCVCSMEILPQLDPAKAKVRSFVIMMIFDSGVPIVAGYGEYHDDVRREKGKWVMAKRYCIAYWPRPQGV